MQEDAASWLAVWQDNKHMGAYSHLLAFGNKMVNLVSIVTLADAFSTNKQKTQALSIDIYKNCLPSFGYFWL